MKNMDLAFFSKENGGIQNFLQYMEDDRGNSLCCAALSTELLYFLGLPGAWSVIKDLGEGFMKDSRYCDGEDLFSHSTFIATVLVVRYAYLNRQ